MTRAVSGRSREIRRSGASREIYRIDWVPGTDLLHGLCHCGAEHTAQDPVAMWEWMLGHPEAHRDGHPEGHREGHPAGHPDGHRAGAGGAS